MVSACAFINLQAVQLCFKLLLVIMLCFSENCLSFISIFGCLVTIFNNIARTLARTFNSSRC